MINLKTYRFAFLALLAITTVSGLQSQTFDTICIPRKDAVKLLTRAEEGKVLAEKVGLLDNHITLLNSRIIELEGMVAAYQLTDDYKDSLIKSYKSEILVMKEQRAIFETAIADTKKELRRYRRKLFWRTTGGVMMTGALAYLYFTK